MSDKARNGGNEFAIALFSLASEETTAELPLDELIAEQLGTVLEVFSKTPEYYELLACHGLSLDERIAALDDAFGGTVHEYLLSFLKLLCEKKRIRELPECAEEYNALLREKKLVVSARIISALELTDKEKQAIKEKLEKISKKTVLPEFCVDTSLLGGIVVEMDGAMMDGSLRHRLQEVKEVMNR